MRLIEDQVIEIQLAEGRDSAGPERKGLFAVVYEVIPTEAVSWGLKSTSK